MARHRKKIIDIASAVVILALIMLDAVLWRDIFAAAMGIARGIAPGGGANIAFAPRVYSLPMAHGTSTLLMLPNGVTMLVDAGSDAAIVDDVQKTLPSGAPAYINLAIISVPQAADYEGYQYLLQHYGVGAFLYNGRADIAHSAEWAQLMTAIAAKRIPLLTIGAGDSIHYGGDTIAITAPDAAHAHSPDASDTAIFLLYNKQ